MGHVGSLTKLRLFVPFYLHALVSCETPFNCLLCLSLSTVNQMGLVTVKKIFIAQLYFLILYHLMQKEIQDCYNVIDY